MDSFQIPFRKIQLSRQKEQYTIFKGFQNWFRNGIAVWLRDSIFYDDLSKRGSNYILNIPILETTNINTF